MAGQLALAAAASFALVFLRAFQQRNVSAARYGWMIATTFGYAFAEALVVLAYVSNGGFHIPSILAVAVGGSLGGVTAVAVSRRMFHD